MDVQRAILLFALAFVLIVLYQRWLEFQVPQTPPAGQTGAQEEAGAPAEDIPETPDAPEAPAETADTGGAPQVPLRRLPGTGSPPTGCAMRSTPTAAESSRPRC